MAGKKKLKISQHLFLQVKPVGHALHTVTVLASEAMPRNEKIRKSR